MLRINEEYVIGSRRVYLTGRQGGMSEADLVGNSIPVIFWPVSEEHGQSLGEAAEYAATRINESTRETDRYVLAAFEVKDWNLELAPWKAEIPEIGQNFGGEGKETLRWIQDAAMPWLQSEATAQEEECGQPEVTVSSETVETADTLSTTEHFTYYIAGYSLGGLFALWALTVSAAFAGAAACSASQWFPGWLDYLEEKGLADIAGCSENPASTGKANRIVYLSLGGKEHKTPNPFVATILDATKRCDALLEKDAAVRKHVLEMNRGGHFSDPDGRVAKGITWILKN